MWYSFETGRLSPGPHRKPADQEDSWGDGPQPVLPLRLLTTCRQEVLPQIAGSPHVFRLSTGLADRPPGRTTMVSAVFQF